MKKIFLFTLSVLISCSIFGQIDIKSSILKPNCGKKDGKIDLCVTGGTAPYSYQWSNSSTNDPISDISEGSYTVTVTDVKGLKTVSTFDVDENSPIAIYTQNEVRPSCDLSKLGSIKLSNPSPNGNYQYFWNTGATTQTINNLKAGAYSVTVTNQDGCKAIRKYDLSPKLYLSDVVTNKSKCPDTFLIKINQITGGIQPYTFKWEADNLIGSDNEDSIYLTKADQYSYRVTVTDAKGCSANIGASILIEGDPNYYSLNPQKTSCTGKGTIIPYNFSGNQPWTNQYFKWSTGEEGLGKASISNLNVGRYYVTITDGFSCPEIREVIVNDDWVKNELQTFVPCSNVKDASAKVIVTSGLNAPINYLWSNGSTNNEVTKLSDGIYFVTVSDSKCKKIEEVEIKPRKYLNFNTEIVKDDGCPKFKVAKIPNGTPPFSYLWNNNQKSDFIDFSSAKDYTSVTVTDAKGCKGYSYGDKSIGNYYNIVKCSNYVSIIPNCCNTNFKYKWDDGDVSSSKKLIKNKNYTVTIADTNTNLFKIESIKGDSIAKPCSPNFTFIEGYTKFDKNFDCQFDNSDLSLQKRVIEILPGPYYGTTDVNGFYKVFLPAGNYEVDSKSLTPYEKFCQNNVDVVLVDSVKVDFISLPLTDCPYMEVDISSPILRRCFDNNYYVKYCNNGTATAKNASIKIDFDENYMTYKSASIPLSSSQNGVLTFNVGDVAVGECKNFSISLYLSCTNGVMGQTHCVKARIFPDSICKSPNSPKVVASAECVGENVILTLQNIGKTAMTSQRDYLIIEDQVIFKKGKFQLAPNEKIDFKMPTTGKTYRIEAEQESTFEFGPDKPSAWAEACGKNPQGFTDGFVTIFGKGDDDPFTSVDCRQSVASYDPNIKEAYPKGYQAAHLLPQNEDLEYTLGFQNEGTDTAFTVVLRDTLDKSLDVNTLRVGASSHANKWSVSSNGILQFTFDKINLTTKNQNEEKSQGFVKFRISQKKDVALGTVIKNRVGIYFDFNTVVMTNEVFHTIGKDFLKVTSVKNPIFEKVEINVYPNPTDNDVTFDLQNIDNQSFELYLFDISGKIIRKENYDTARFLFKRENLSGGMYFYQIKTKGQLICNGKLIIF